MFAIAEGKADYAAEILKHKPNLDVPLSFGKTAIHFAAEGGFDALVGQLLKAGASISGVDENGVCFSFSGHLCIMLL
jgi:ankyrin repeat protein